MTYAFDGATKRITLSAVTVLSLPDLYSRYKDWFGTDPSCEVAFGTVGGDIPAIPLYLFLQNGWKIVPQAADHVLTVTNGILETSDGSDPFVDPAGSYKIRINRATPGIAIGYTTGSGVTAQDKTDIAAATLAAAQVTPIDANVKNTTEVADEILNSQIGTSRPTGSLGEFLAKKVLTIAKFIGLK